MELQIDEQQEAAVLEWWEQDLDLDLEEDEGTLQDLSLEDVDGCDIATTDLLGPEDMEGTDKAELTGGPSLPSTSREDVEEGELIDELLGEEILPPGTAPGTVLQVEKFVWERMHGPECHQNLKEIRQRRGHLLKGVLGPPVVDYYIKNILRMETGKQWDRELERKRYKLGHGMSESIAACYTSMERAQEELVKSVDYKMYREVLALLRYGMACLCNALHEWRRQRGRALLQRLLSPGQWWLCNSIENRGCRTLFGKQMARDLRRHVFRSRSGRVAEVLHREMHSKDKSHFSHRKNSESECLVSMERWVERGCDVFEEKERLENEGVKLTRIIVAGKIESRAKQLQKRTRERQSKKKQLCRSEYSISCDLANAANSLIAALALLPPLAGSLAGSLETAAHLVCICLFRFDTYRRAGFLSALGLGRNRVNEMTTAHPIENDGTLIGDPLMSCLEQIMKKRHHGRII